LSRRGFIAVLAAGAVAAGIPATAVAQTPAEATTTVTAAGAASIPVRKPAHPSDATIGAAVRAAQAKVGPAAIAAARQEAERLASALGLTLGALQSVAEQPSPFGPFFGVNGVGSSFGAGRYCGTVRRRIFRRAADGPPVPTRRIVSRRVCRTPPYVATSVSVTFLAS
jgi:Protein of unknown function (DUF541)